MDKQIGSWIISWNQFTTVKDPNDKDIKNEDSIKIFNENTTIPKKCILFCLSDGATGGAYSFYWSQLLCEIFPLTNLYKEFNQQIDLNGINILEFTNLCESKWVLKYDINKEEDPLLKEYMKGGTAGTFLALEIEENKKKLIYKLLRIGDSYEFIFNNGKEVTDTKSEFIHTRNPPLLRTSNIPNRWKDVKEKLMYKRGELVVNDVLYLSTDEMSEWIVKYGIEGDSENLNQLLEIRDQENFETWVEEKRKLNEMKRDDVSLVIIQIKRSS